MTAKYKPSNVEKVPGVGAGRTAGPQAAWFVKLTPEQRSQLAEELNLGAVSYGFLGHIWTRSRANVAVEHVIRCKLQPDAGGTKPEKGRMERSAARPAESRQEGPPAERVKRSSSGGRRLCRI